MDQNGPIPAFLKWDLDISAEIDAEMDGYRATLDSMDAHSASLLKGVVTLAVFHSGRCAICGNSSDHALILDHDRNDGKVRGYLCSSCDSSEYGDPEHLFEAYRANPPTAVLGIEMMYSEDVAAWSYRANGMKAIPLEVQVNPAVGHFGVHNDISEGVLSRLAPYLEASDADNTTIAYQSDWKQFQRWCEARHIEDFPVASSLLLDYLVDRANTIKPDGGYAYAPSTLQRYRASIDRIHRDLRLAVPGDHPLVRQFLKGLKRTRQYRAVRKAPLLLEDVRSMLSHMTRYIKPYASSERRDRLMILMGFGGAFRRSELASIRIEDVRIDRHDGLAIYLRSSKTDQLAQGAVKAIPYGTTRHTCVVCAYIDWIEMLENPRLSVGMGLVHDKQDGFDGDGHICRQQLEAPSVQGYLFRSVTAGGGVTDRGVDSAILNRVLKKYAQKAGIDAESIGGHSLRAGFVTQALRNGADAHSIMRQTGHKNPVMIEVYARESAPLENNAVANLGL